MAEQIDPLSGELSLEAALTESGIKATAKSRFLVAIDRLFGGLVDIPGAMIEGRAQRRRLENDLERARLRRAAELSLESISAMQRLEAAAAYARREDDLRRFLNKRESVLEAVEDLREAQQDDVSTEGELEDDWLNVYGAYAERASSDRLRSLWGKILAGEIRQPGSFSLTTLRMLSELDQRIAQLFQKHVRGILQGIFLVKDEKLEGALLMELTSLEEVGLLQDASGTIQLTVTFNDEGHYAFRTSSLALIAKGKPGTKVHVPVIKISSVGQEILKILPIENEDVALRKFGNVIAEKAESVQLVKIEPGKASGKENYSVLAVIK